MNFLRFLHEDISDYQNSVERALAGFLTDKKDDQLDDKEVKFVNKLINDKKLTLPKYYDLSFILSRKNNLDIERELKALFSMVGLNIDKIRLDINKLAPVENKPQKDVKKESITINKYNNNIDLVTNEARKFKVTKDMERELERASRIASAGAGRLEVIKGAQSRRAAVMPNNTKRRKLDKYRINYRNYEENMEEKLKETFSIGEEVKVGGKVGVVKNINGPHNTIGVLRDGKLQMFSRKQVEKLDENILGVTSVEELGRLRKLAGLNNETPSIKKEMKDIKETLDNLDFDTLQFEDDDDGEVLNSLPSDEPDMSNQVKNDLHAPEDNDADFEPDMDDDMNTADSADMSPEVPPATSPEMGDEMGSDMDDQTNGDMSDMGGMNNMEQPSDAMAPPAPMVDQAMGESNAFDTIMQALNDVQSKLSDVKISEYKQIVKKINELLAAVRNAGYEYLKESVDNKKAFRYFNEQYKDLNENKKMSSSKAMQLAYLRTLKKFEVSNYELDNYINEQKELKKK